MNYHSALNVVRDIVRANPDAYLVNEGANALDHTMYASMSTRPARRPTRFAQAHASDAARTSARPMLTQVSAMVSMISDDASMPVLAACSRFRLKSAAWLFPSGT